MFFLGKLVINKNYRTNDPKIYAAGTITKYSRKYHATHLNHKYFNRAEIGEHCGKIIKELLLPEEVGIFRFKLNLNSQICENNNS